MRFFYTPYFISWFTKRLVWYIPTGEKTIYLTFDDGPTKESTEWILETLNSYDAKATFFCVGENVKKHTNLVNRIIDNAHSVGNHTCHHLNGAKTKNDKYLEDVIECSKALKSNLFRPPYGKIKPAQVKAIKKLGFKIIMWSVLSYDFDDISEDLLLQKCIKHTKPGSIIVFHDSKKSIDKLKSVLPPYLEFCKSNGYKFAPISF